MKIVRYLLTMGLVLLVGGVVVGVVFFMGLPWWYSIGALGFIFALWFGVIFLRRYLARRRERKFVKRVIEEDTQRIKDAPEYRRADLLEVQKKWKEAIRLLSTSKLAKKGNPLYVLPWFLFLGEAGEGKTTALRNARLASPLTDIPRVSGIAGTQNFDWWFFEKAIILDTAGRYAVPVDEVVDREEWERFLTLLAKYRKKEPLNGVVVTVSCESLFKKESAQLIDVAQYIRRRIDQIMRVTGYKIPVYLMITKIDLINGMTAFAEAVPENYFNQCVGYANEELEGDWKRFLEDGFSYIVERLKKIRFLLLQQREEPEPGLLLFPQELEKLYPGLKAFCEGLFAPNPYQEPPLFRGIYLTSATQEGRVISDFLETFKLEKFARIHPTIRETGIFLRDFFNFILPGDRFLFSPIKEFQRWRKTTFSLALLTWIFLNLGMAAVIVSNYEHNLQVLSQGRHISSLVMGKDEGSNVLMLARYEESVSSLQKEVDSYWIPRLGYNYDIKYLSILKERFRKRFQNYVLSKMDSYINKQIHELSSRSDEKSSNLLIKNIDFMVNRINILRSISAKEKISQDVWGDLSYEVPFVFPKVSQELVPYFVRCYRYYLQICSPEAIEDQLNVVISELKNIIHLKGGDLHWIVEHPALRAFRVSLSSIWGLSNISEEEDIFLPGAYTVKGKEKIDEFVKFLMEALKGQNVIGEDTLRDFYKWYRISYYNEWQRFMWAFPRGKDLIGSWDVEHDVTSRMCNVNNPLIILLNTFVSETKRLFPSDTKAPKWVIPVFILQEAITEAHLQSTSKEPTGNLKQSLKKFFFRKFSKLKAATASFSNLKQAHKYQDVLKIATRWKDYEKNMSQIAGITTDVETAYAMTSEFFPYGRAPQESKSPFFLAKNDLYGIRLYLKKYGSVELVSMLMEYPLKFVTNYAVMETSCFLENKWEEQVLSRIEGLNFQDKIRLLFEGEQSLVNKFLKGPARPFVGENKFGYYPRRAMGVSIPFQKGFFDFINKGKRLFFSGKKEFEVTIRTLPISVNKGARLSPYGCQLVLECAPEKYTLENLNFPVKKIFRWSSSSCGETRLSIYFPGLKLVKTYEGVLGFARFLKDFRDGTHVFTPADFPENRDFLRSNHIFRIQVSYDIQGASPIVKLLQEIPKQIPDIIVYCWHQ